MNSPKDMLPHCGGRLSVQEATAGMNAAIANAKRLVADAELLLENERFASALALAILAIEEGGKVSILRRVLVAKDEELKACWKEYRDHRSKNAAWILPDLIQRGARTMNVLRLATDGSAPHTAELDVLKQISLYTDFVGKRNWTSPEAVVEKDTADSFVKLASSLVREREVTEEENRVWVRHLGPESEHGMTRAGLVEFFMETIEKGLLPHDEGAVLRFVYGGVSDVSEG